MLCLGRAYARQMKVEARLCPGRRLPLVLCAMHTHFPGCSPQGLFAMFQPHYTVTLRDETTCPHSGVPETLQHVLLDCPAYPNRACPEILLATCIATCFILYGHAFPACLQRGIHVHTCFQRAPAQAPGARTRFDRPGPGSASLTQAHPTPHEASQRDQQGTAARSLD